MKTVKRLAFQPYKWLVFLPGLIHKPFDPCFGSAKLLDESYKIIE